MSTFTDEGFLSTSMGEWSKECSTRYSEWFILCKDFNLYCLQFLKNLKISNNSRQESFGVALFIRLLSLFESSIILAERCMGNETKVLLRTLMETLFILRSIVKDKAMAERYYENHSFEKLQNLRLIKRHGQASLYQGLDLDKRIEELDNIVKQKGIKKLTVQWWADKAGLNEFYATAYPVLSWTAHSNVIDIGQYLSGKSDEEIEEISWHPQIEGMNKLLLTAMECAIIGLRSVNELFSLVAVEKIEEYSQRYHLLAKKLVAEQRD